MPTVAEFTGKERDAETGLDYFGARYFSSPQGRFTSPDPKQSTARTLAIPQKWNKYAYVQNNPLAFIDPDGEDDIYVFRPREHSDGQRFAEIKAVAEAHHNRVITYNGGAATSSALNAALRTRGAHVVAGDVHSMPNLLTGKAASIIMGDGTAAGQVGNAEHPQAAVPGIGEIKAASVAFYGCNTTQMANQYADADTAFVGVSPKIDVKVLEIGTAAHVEALANGGTVADAAVAARDDMVPSNQAFNQTRAQQGQTPRADPRVCVTENGKTTCK